MSDTDNTKAGRHPQRVERLRQVMHDCIRQRAEGEPVSDASLIKAHPDLMPELADQLRKLCVVEAAKRQVDSNGDMEPSSLHVRCPHCHYPMKVHADSRLSGLPCPSCGSTFSLVDESGTVPAGKPGPFGRFRLLERLGVGAFGSVWSAQDTQLDRLVAVKIPRKRQMDSEEAEKFIREARAAAQLTHPHIVRVHEVGREGDRVYIVSDCVQGVDLADWLTGHKATPREAAELCAAVADALDHAHQRGVIHRDLKPSNIMLDTQGAPHLLDFGLAKRETGEITMTVDGKLLGTPAYMSPEQARGAAHEADRRSDIYSLGVILFEVLTGERPFRGSTRMLLHQVLIEDAPGPRKLNGHVPKDLETICLKCLEKDASRRYQTARELGDDLRRFLRGQSVQARPITAAARSWRWCKRNPLPAALAAALLVVLVSGLAGVTSLWIRAVDSAESLRRHLYLSDIRVVQQAWEVNDVERCLELLSRHRPRRGQVDLRDFEWCYLWRLCRRSEMTPTLQQPGIGHVAFSPDGTRLATTGGRTLKLWDVRTRKELLQFEAHEHAIPGLAFSPDGRMLATSSWDGKVKLWQLGTDKEPAILRAEIPIECRGYALAFSPDGDQLATNGPDNAVLLWDVHDRSRVRSLSGHDGVVLGLAFSPDGTMLASGGTDNSLWLWDIHSGRGEAISKPHEDWVWSVAFSPDGATLASGGRDHAIKLWDVATRQLRARLQQHTSGVSTVAFSPDGKTLASSSWDGTVKLWDPRTGCVLDTMKGHSRPILTVAFSPDGRTLASGCLGKVKLWDLAPVKDRDTMEGKSVAFSAHGETLASWTPDGRLRWWDTATGRLKAGPAFKHSAAGCAMLSPDAAKVATGSSEGTVVLHDLENGETRQLPGQHERPVEFVMFSPHGNSLVSVGGSELKLWDLANLRLRTGLEVYRVVGPVFAIAFSPDGKTLAIGCEEEPGTVYSLKLWDLSRKKLTTFHRNAAPIGSAAFSCDGTMLAVGGWDGKITLWNVVAGKQLLSTLEGHPDGVSSLAFSSRGTRLASAGANGTVKLWSLRTGENTITLNGDHRRYASVTFSPDGNTLASAGESGTVKVWRAAKEAELRAAGWLADGR